MKCTERFARELQYTVQQRRTVLGGRDHMEEETKKDEEIDRPDVGQQRDTTSAPVGCGWRRYVRIEGSDEWARRVMTL